jgi:hypothetical protein
MISLRRFWRRMGVALNLRDPPNVPPYGWSYFDHLVAVYVTLNSADARADKVIAKSTDRPDDLTWGDIFLLENVLLSLQPPEVLSRTTWIMRERFREIACPTVYDKYTASSPPAEWDSPAKLALLKADLTRILDVLHWHYALIPMRERMRKSLTKWCIFYVIFYTAALGSLLYRFHHSGYDFAAMMACVVYWGIIGGFVSSQRRMESIPSDGDPLISVFGLDSADYYLWLSPLLGAIFAVILTLMFIAGILKGALFPDFSIIKVDHGLSYFEFAWKTLPKSGEEYAKLFVWSFLAGFAERLVPDSLDRLGSKLEPETRSANPKSASEPKPSLQQTGSGGQQAKPKISSETLENVMHTGQEAPQEASESSSGPQSIP